MTEKQDLVWNDVLALYCSECLQPVAEGNRKSPYLFTVAWKGFTRYTSSVFSVVCTG